MYAWLPLEISLSGAYILGVNMEQPIYTGGKISAGNRMADIGVDMASENLDLQRMNTIQAADFAYWTYIAVSEQVRLAKQAVDMLAGLVELAQNSLEVGMVSRNDLLKVQVEFNNARLNLQKAENGLELSRMQLCMITGLPFDTSITASDTIIQTNQPIPAAMEGINVSQRPEYRLLEKNIRMGEQNIRMARADFLPTAGIQAGYSHIGGIEFSGTDFSNTSLNIIGSVKIPLFHWGQGARKIKNARLDLEMKELELEKKPAVDATGDGTGPLEPDACMGTYSNE
jgi:outer membrane protein TolC